MLIVLTGDEVRRGRRKNDGPSIVCRDPRSGRPRAAPPDRGGRCGVCAWPIEGRFKGGTGKPGLLHVKCVVADGRWLFLSSANLTESAFSINMELGVLSTGEHLPDRVESHFRTMIQVGVLAKA
jgi:hypothetical protein